MFFFHCYSNLDRAIYKQTVETLIRRLVFVASDLGLHCLSIYHKKDASHYMGQTQKIHAFVGIANCFTHDTRINSIHVI